MYQASTVGIQYCISAFICAVILFYSLFVASKTTIRYTPERLICYSVLCFAIGAIGDIAFGLREFGIVVFPDTVSYCTEMIYFFGGIIEGFFWLIYSETYQNSWMSQKSSRRLIALIPMVLIFLSGISTPLTHWLFYFENGLYHRGTLMVPITVIALLFIEYTGITALIRSFNKVNYVNRTEYRLIFFYAMAIILVQLVQMIFETIMPYRSMVFALVFLVVVMHRLKQNSTLDIMTGLNNRFALERYLNQKLQTSEKFSVAIIDIDEFKKINDTYGHKKGDDAIKLLANVFCMTIPRNCFIARVGGDEFVIAGAVNTEEFAEIGSNVKMVLKETIEEKKFGCNISISAGIAEKDDSITTIPDLLEKADEELYKRKRFKKEQQKAVK